MKHQSLSIKTIHLCERLQKGEPKLEREELQQAEELLTQMKYNQALQIVESIEKEETLTQDDLLTCQILKSQIVTGKGAYEEGKD